MKRNLTETIRETAKERGRGGFGITGGDISEIHLYSGIARFVKGLEDETSLLILWYFHKARLGFSE